MQTTILQTSAISLIPTCHFGRPVPAHGPEEPPPVVPVTNFPDIGTVDGDQAPDFSEFDKKYGTAGPDVIPPAPDPAKGEVKKPVETPPAGPSGPSGPKTEEKAPESSPTKPVGPSGASGPSGPEPKKAALSGPSGASGPSGPAEFDPDAALKKLDAIQPKPTASQKTLDGFRDIKEITKAAIAKNKEYLTKIADLEKTPKIDKQVEQELGELREFKATFEAQNDPKIAEEFKKSLESAEDKILEVLTTDEDLMMPADDAAALKAAGFDTPNGRTMMNTILNKIAKTGDILLLDRVKDMFRNRKVVVEDHEKKLAEIQGKAGKYWEGQQAREEEERKTWAGNADQSLIKLFEQPGYEWGHYKKIEEGMDAASKEAAEKHNTHLKDVIVPQIREGIQAVYYRDPVKAMEYVAKAHAVDNAMRQVADMQSQLDAANQRIKELEDTARGVQRISDPTREDSAPQGDAANIRPSTVDMTAEQAADAFLEQKYGRRG